MITYILKATLFSALLFLIYAVFLEKEKMHRFKRFYLLTGIALSFIVPIITIPNLSFIPPLPAAINLSAINPAGSDISDSPITSYNITESDRAVADIQNKAPQPATASGSKGFWFILLVVSYFMVTLVMIFRFIRNIVTIYLTIKSNRFVTYHEGTLVLTKENRIPHSFLKYIFVNRADYERGSIEKEILRHELTHVSQKHSLDILFVELILIFAWINPLLFLFRRAIRLNHEFLADQSVVEAYTDTQTYKYLLFEKTRHANILTLSSPFNYLLTKKRIIMMSRKASPGIAILKQIAIIPLIIIAGFLFTSKSAVYEIESDPLQHQSEPVQNFDEDEEQNQQRLEFERLITPGSGVSQELLDEYEKIISKYTPASMTGGEQTTNIQRNITPEDKARLVEVYSSMSVEQRKEQRVIFLPYAFMLWEKNPPTPEQLEQFKNPQEYGIWIDEGRVSNEVLANFSNTDFARVFVSRLSRTAKNYGIHDYSVGLYTNEYVKNHNDYYSKDEYMLQYRIKAP